jgi:hypothetical protein
MGLYRKKSELYVFIKFFFKKNRFGKKTSLYNLFEFRIITEH